MFGEVEGVEFNGTGFCNGKVICKKTKFTFDEIISGNGVGESIVKMVIEGGVIDEIVGFTVGVCRIVGVCRFD